MRSIGREVVGHDRERDLPAAGDSSARTPRARPGARRRSGATIPGHRARTWARSSGRNGTSYDGDDRDLRVHRPRVAAAGAPGDREPATDDRLLLLGDELVVAPEPGQGPSGGRAQRLGFRRAEDRGAAPRRRTGRTRRPPRSPRASRRDRPSRATALRARQAQSSRRPPPIRTMAASAIQTADFGSLSQFRRGIARSSVAGGPVRRDGSRGGGPARGVSLWAHNRSVMLPAADSRSQGTASDRRSRAPGAGSRAARASASNAAPASGPRMRPDSWPASRASSGYPRAPPGPRVRARASPR